MTTADKNVKSVKISLKAKDENAKIEICRNGVGNGVGLKNVNEIVSAENGKNQITEQEVALVAGLNIITARVIAEDGTTQEIYRFLVTRTGAQDASIGGISVDNKEVAGFDVSEKILQCISDKRADRSQNRSEKSWRRCKSSSECKWKTYNPQESIPVSGDNMTVGIAITPDGGVTEHYSLSLRVPSDSNAKLEKSTVWQYHPEQWKL